MEIASRLMAERGFHLFRNAPNGVETTRGFIGNMVTKSIPDADKEWIIERNLRMPRQRAATLLYNHATQDWGDLIPRLELPTLVVGGRVSVVPWQFLASR